MKCFTVNCFTESGDTTVDPFITIKHTMLFNRSRHMNWEDRIGCLVVEVDDASTMQRVIDHEEEGQLSQNSPPGPKEYRVPHAGLALSPNQQAPMIIPTPEAPAETPRALVSLEFENLITRGKRPFVQFLSHGARIIAGKRDRAGNHSTLAVMEPGETMEVIYNHKVKTGFIFGKTIHFKSKFYLFFDGDDVFVTLEHNQDARELL